MSKSYVITAEIEDREYGYSVNPYKLPPYFLPHLMKYPFRLLDDDGIVMYYGLALAFGLMEPLDDYQPHVGCTSIEYWNGTIWEAM